MLIFIVAYNAEKTISDVLRRIPSSLGESYDVEVLVIDDASQDQTFERGQDEIRTGELPFPIRVLYNPVNQGYGGNQKIGFHYAIENGFDFVALVHGDGQYAPECLPNLVAPLAAKEADAIFGSRMITAGAARTGGMPLYKFVGNKILTWFQNQLLGANLSEFHSGYRVYAIESLRRIPFQLNTNVFHFDTEIIIQLLIAGGKIKELPIPTYYGDEICHVDGLKYAWDVALTTAKATTQKLGLIYDRKFDCAADMNGAQHYAPKMHFVSPQTEALSRVRPHSKVIDFGCAGGQLDAALRETGCYVIGVDKSVPNETAHFDQFIEHDLDERDMPINLEGIDCLLMLDIIEHLKSPERFVDMLRNDPYCTPAIRIVVSTGNVAFLLTRIALIFGMFNYGPRGILDLTHTRLFTFATIRRLFVQAGFEIIETKGIPAPIPLALGDTKLARVLLRLNCMAIKVWRSMFAYQVFMVVQPRPSLAYLLDKAETKSTERANSTA